MSILSPNQTKKSLYYSYHSYLTNSDILLRLHAIIVPPMTSLPFLSYSCLQMSKVIFKNISSITSPSLFPITTWTCLGSLKKFSTLQSIFTQLYSHSFETLHSNYEACTHLSPFLSATTSFLSITPRTPTDWSDFFMYLSCECHFLTIHI